MSRIQHKSDEETRKLRTNTRGYTTVKPVTKNLLNCPELIGQRFKYPVPGEYVSVMKMVTITDLYPSMAIAKYKGGYENDVELSVGLSIGDLIESGVLSFKNGYPEVI